MDSLRNHPAFTIQTDLGVSQVGVYERRPSVVEAVPLVRITYASHATPDDLATAVMAAYQALDVQAEPHAFGVDARLEADRWRYSNWPHGRCSQTAVTVRVAETDLGRKDERTGGDHVAAPPVRSRSWLQVTALGCNRP